MDLLSKIRNAISLKPKNQTNLVGAESFRTANPYGLYNHFHSDAYASAYPSIRSIAHEYMGIRPKAIDSNGKPVQNNSIVNALYHPNQLDSSVSFFEKIAVSTLVLPKTFILVWRNEGGEAKPGGDFGAKGKNIAGFTFLEKPAITIRDKQTYYNIGSQEFNENEVMVLTGGVDPHNLYNGYSPSIASKKWATLDDYIADFQKGFFENGAVPAGQMVITSVTNKDFEDTKKTLQEKHRGIGNNNNIVYVPRPVGADGKPAEAKIEWIPFSHSNKEIDFKNLFEQANKRLDLAFGVPAIVKGVDDAATYANAQVAEKTFAQRAVYPLALRNYTQITHELNRMTGGIGVAITFDYEIPTVADEEKVNAETKNIEANLIRVMTLEGYSLDSVVQAFELSNSYKLLKKDAALPVIENDKPDVDEGDEVEGAPDPKKIDGVTPLNRLKPKAELSDQQQLEATARQYMQVQVDRVVEEYKDEPVDEVEPTPKEDELDAFVLAMMAIVISILIANGETEYSAGIALAQTAGASTAELQGFALSDTAQDAYRGYLRRVGTTYGEDTAEAIRKVLADSNELGWTRTETEKALKNVMDTDDWRIKRLARTELNHSQAQGSLEGMRELAAETGVQFEKALDHSNTATTPCEFCLTYEGQWYALDNPLLGLGETVVGTEGTIFVNDFASYEAGDIHPNGRGSMIYRIAGGANAATTQKLVDEQKETIKGLETKVSELDGRTKEAKELKAKIEDMEKYIAQLEGIIDGQG